MPQVARGDTHGRRVGFGRTALVCGASSGIGRSLSEVLAAEGFDVLLLARRKQHLVELADQLAGRFAVQARPIVADLADPATPGRIVAELTDSGQHVDFLVNNAGYTLTGRFDELDWEEHERHLRVMALAPVEMTHRLVPAMVREGWGRIITVSSIAGMFTGTPMSTLYGGEKALLQRFRESIDAELKEFGIRCTVSVPGFTDTPLAQSGVADESRDWLYRAVIMSPERVARQAYNAVMAGRPQVVHGLHHRAIALAVQMAPQRVRRAISNSIAGMHA
ncbi:SDR family NAD(P)-dependent oxidoreductase [Mycolicibacterium porcinum]|uniref:SDR family NAD(P)-dependent oxidoreductase n=1 Tax=Mycolicibacterium porcinum TaxID=39693 RepID=A0AAW5SX55_9MYCO|nr:SDR family NAD(P)-dependent oxidoreductase [Mycolicibacterium porcinum]MCV7386473.1 SDR family NAD(P)-dependent oxidoreductase [Mycolicibacterium porcinum]ORB39033.1 hypothetical protein BST41_18630 [Mycolicibacterium porcinum]CDO30857.1 ketoacyl reductase [Mycolicibacterium vulneris]